MYMRYHKKKYACDKVCYHEKCYLHLSFSVSSYCEKYRCNIFYIILEIWRAIIWSRIHSKYTTHESCFR